mgnify:CR=1 FL=1
MRTSSFRHRVSESMASLPILVVIASVLWIIPNIQSVALWGGLAVVALMSYLVLAWNAQYQLIRVRSRMNSLTFLYLFLVFPQLHPLGWHLFPAACLLGAYFLLFRTYGVYAPQGYFFHAFFLIGLGSLVFPPLLLLLPFLIFSSSRHLRALTLKSATAAFLGVSLPYWLLLPVYLFAREALTPHLSFCSLDHQLQDPLQLFQPSHLLHLYQQLPLSQWVGTALFLVISLVSVVHFLRTAYNDKIRTRQYHYLLLLQVIPLLVVLGLLPQHFTTTFPLCIVTIAPLIGHYFALAKGRGLNLWFILWLILFFLYGTANYFNLWTLLSNF